MPTHRKRLDMNQKKYKRSATDLQRRSSPAAIFVITVVAAGAVFVGWKAIAPLSRDTTTDVTVPRLCPRKSRQGGVRRQLRAYANVPEARASISRYLAFYNGRRPQSSLGGQAPDQAYLTTQQPIPAAA